jgi:hypothetical protein
MLCEYYNQICNSSLLATHISYCHGLWRATMKIISVSMCENYVQRLLLIASTTVSPISNVGRTAVWDLSRDWGVFNARPLQLAFCSIWTFLLRHFQGCAPWPEADTTVTTTLHTRSISHVLELGPGSRIIRELGTSCRICSSNFEVRNEATCRWRVSHVRMLAAVTPVCLPKSWKVCCWVSLITHVALNEEKS